MSTKQAWTETQLRDALNEFSAPAETFDMAESLIAALLDARAEAAEMRAKFDEAFARGKQAFQDVELWHKEAMQIRAERDALKAERTPEYEEALMRNQALRTERDELHELAAERKAHADILRRNIHNLQSQAWKVEAERDALAAKLAAISATQRTHYDAEARAVAAEAGLERATLEGQIDALEWVDSILVCGFEVPSEKLEARIAELRTELNNLTSV